VIKLEIGRCSIFAVDAIKPYSSSDSRNVITLDIVKFTPLSVKIQLNSNIF